MRIPLVVLALSSILAGQLQAQSLTQRVQSLFSFGACGQPLCLDVDPERHGLHFLPELVQGRDNLLAFLTGSIGASIATIPVSAASGGTVFTFENGAPVQSAVSPGPIFAERAQTIGRGRLFVSANVNQFSYEALRGTDLEDLTFSFTHQNVAGPQLGDLFFEKDIIQVDADLDVSALVTSFVATYGLTDRLDVGVAVPLVWTSVTGASQAHIIPVDPAQPLHRFGGTAENPMLHASATADGSSIGLGDVAVRAKAQLAESGAWAFGLLADARLPTGNEEDFSGTGAVGFRALGVASAQYGGFSPHVNAGFAYRGSDLLSDAILTTVGFDQLLVPSATFAFDVIAEWQVGESLGLPDPVVFDDAQRTTVELSNIGDMRDDLIYGNAGLKLSIGPSMNLVASSLVPLSRGGLQPRIGWTLGLEANF